MNVRLRGSRARRAAGFACLLLVLAAPCHPAGLASLRPPAERPLVHGWTVGAEPAQAGCAALAPATSVASSGTYFAIAAVSAHDLWAVGAISTAGAGMTKTLVVHGDGRHWRVVPSPNASGLSNSLSAIAAVSPSDVWAAGTTRLGNGETRALMEQWDGRRWHIVAVPLPAGIDSSLSGLAALSRGDVWAVGTAFTASGQDQTLAEHWDGRSWRIIPTPNPGLTGSALSRVVALSPRDIWAVGESIRYKRDTLTEHWDGRRWTVVPSPTRPGGDNRLFAVSAVSDHDIWAVGAIGNYSGPAQPLVEHWNGVRWGVVPDPALAVRSSGFTVVVALSTRDVWALGAAGSSLLNPTETVAAHWDGTHWQMAPFPRAGSPAAAVGLSAADIWVVSVPPNPGLPQPPTGALVTHWDGTRWCVS